ncbi:MAG: ComF family protein [Proteobacteria bacterium]|nr:ComF family protein [Pseudomonadota bacterium]
MNVRFLERAFCFLFEPSCPICGKRVMKISLCPKCSDWPKVGCLNEGSWVGSTYFFTEPAKLLIHSIKYQHHFERLRLLRPFLPKTLPNLRDSKLVLVPVPLSPLRFFERGFNQSEWLAAELGKRFLLKVETKAFIKKRETKAQSTLSRSEREMNLIDAFQWDTKRPVPKRICLIDDVFTTGSTMEACRSSLYKAGVKEVFGWTLFKATTGVFDSRENI